MVSTAVGSHVPPLGLHGLTRWYDPIVRWTLRETRWRDRLVGDLGLAPGDRVLDLGCGTGSLLLRAKAVQPGAEVIGVDVDRAALAIAAAKIRRTAVQAQLQRGRATDLPFKDAAFDVIVSALLFHHLSPAEKLIAAQEAFRVLRPGGVLGVADWGRPVGALSAAGFLVVRMLDGFTNTAVHRRGRLVGIFETAGFVEIHVMARVGTVVGTLDLFRARRAQGTSVA